MRTARQDGAARRGTVRLQEARTLTLLLPTLALVLAPGPAAPVHAQSPGYRAVPVEHGATLEGRVLFRGEVPRPRRYFITKDVEVCGTGYRERYEIEVGEGNGLRNVVIAIEGVETGKPWPERASHYQLSQENCTFSPHVQVVPAGAELDILNPDPVLHNVHAFELIGTAARTMFNFGQPPEQRVITSPVRPRRGRHIRLECDAHDFMLGWIYAADTPYAALVDADGRFAIADVPPGTYRVTAWHPYLGVQEKEITLGPGASASLTFEFEPTP